jgi:amino acid transporter
VMRRGSDGGRSIVIRGCRAQLGFGNGRDIRITLGRSFSISVCVYLGILLNGMTDFTGIYMICVSPAAYGVLPRGAHAALTATIVGPFLLAFFLIFISGIILSERPSAKKRYEKGDHWEEYKAYLNKTSILIPLPPSLYARIPTIIKRTLLFEFPIFVFDPAKHSDKRAPGEREHEEHADHREESV